MVDARSTDEDKKRLTRGSYGGVFVYLLRVRPRPRGAKEPAARLFYISRHVGESSGHQSR